MSAAAEPDAVLTVGEITRRIRGTLEDAYHDVWVRGEISGFKRSDRGHLYFAMKEGTTAVLDCVMWKGASGRLSFEPRDGTEVEAFGSVTVYEPRGRYQLAVTEMRPAGLGALLLALEQLKQRLSAEGLFDVSRKRPLPRAPGVVGLVTSPTGAAVRDLIKVLRARWPAARIVLAPVRVQGEGAAAEIAEALARFDRWGGAGVVIVGRGGGSLEDLWAFNEEAVVRAVAASRTPTISAVGHEVDWSLCDLAADVRAATPSHAAEIAVPDHRALRATVEALVPRLRRALLKWTADHRRLLERLLSSPAFRRPLEQVHERQRRVDELVERGRRLLRASLAGARRRLAEVSERYGLRDATRARVRRGREHLGGTRDRLVRGMVGAVHGTRHRLTAYGDRLRALSPRAVVERGYSLVRGPDGRLLRTAESLALGDVVTIEFARGGADARVEALRNGGTHGEED